MAYYSKAGARQPTSIRLDSRLKGALLNEAERQHRSLAELIVFILTEYCGRVQLKTRRRRKLPPGHIYKDGTLP